MHFELLFFHKNICRAILSSKSCVLDRIYNILIAAFDRRSTEINFLVKIEIKHVKS